MRKTTTFRHVRLSTTGTHPLRPNTALTRCHNPTTPLLPTVDAGRVGTSLSFAISVSRPPDRERFFAFLTIDQYSPAVVLRDFLTALRFWDCIGKLHLGLAKPPTSGRGSRRVTSSPPAAHLPACNVTGGNSSNRRQTRLVCTLSSFAGNPPERHFQTR